MPLFVVFTNLPGPGAAALLDEIPHGRDAGDGWKRDEQGVVWVAVPEAKAAVDGACEFVELETEHGKGVGPSSGVTWHTDSSFLSDKTYAKLGPFVAESEHRAALGRLVGDDAALAAARIVATWLRRRQSELQAGENLSGTPNGIAREILQALAPIVAGGS